MDNKKVAILNTATPITKKAVSNQTAYNFIHLYIFKKYYFIMSYHVWSDIATKIQHYLVTSKYF